MMQALRSGVSERDGFGEQQDRARRRRKAWVIGGAFAAGLGAGLAAGFQHGGELFAPGDGWPPTLAIGIALSYVIAVIGGGLALARQTDEFELQRQYKAVALAAMVYMLVYPVWFALWMGGLVGEPMHAILFGLFWLSLAAASIFYRFR